MHDMPECANWADIPLEERVRRVCALRHALAENPQSFVDVVALPFRRSPVETLAGEILPLADACAFLERNAVKILSPRRLGASGRPAWLMGVDAEIRREPYGTILIISPQNYPLMLAGIQTVQALVAGNRVLWKPAPGTRQVANLFAETLVNLGVPPIALMVLDESIDVIRPWLGRVDKVILTGSQLTGKAVMRDLAEHLTPSVMELSGCDPSIVLPDADLDLVANCLRFGLEFNGSASCIAPRRILVDQSVAEPLAEKLASALTCLPPVASSINTRNRLNEVGQAALQDGAKLIVGELPCAEPTHPLVFDFVRPEMRLVQEDLMAPVVSIIRVANADEALAAARHCPYRLGASIFGSVRMAHDVARRIDAGCVIINDLIVPTADPRLPFSGRGTSGFGVTRGAEGLLEMTRIKTISTRRHGPRFHLRRQDSHTTDILRAQLQFAHGRSRWKRFAGSVRLLSSVRNLLQDRSFAKENETHES